MSKEVRDKDGRLSNHLFDSSDISKDEIFDLISNPRRRYILRYARSIDDETFTLSDLAEQVAAWELEKDVDELTANERKTVYTSLQQTHLPRLESAGMITIENGQIAMTDRVQQLNIYLDIVPENSIPWSVYYFGISIFAGIIVAALWADVLPTDPLPELGYIAAIVGMYMVSAAYHTLVTYRYRLEDSQFE